MALIVSRSEVEHLLRTSGPEIRDALLERMEAGYREMAEGVVRQHDRIYLRYPDEGVRRPPGLFSMSALLPGAGIMGTRLNALTGRESGGGDGVLILFGHPGGDCLAITDDSAIHPYRTGTPSALATRYLARPDSRVVACIGSSGIGRGALTMVCHVLPAVEAIRVYSPTPGHRERFAAELTEALGIPATATASAEAAAASADVVITATNADRPVVGDGAIKPGTHVNVMARNEIEMATFRRGKIVTTSTERLLAWDPPWHEPIAPDWVHCELGDVITGRAGGRTSDREVTVFVGSAPASMWDVVAAAVLHDAARKRGVGTEVAIGS
jgi:alanine dehydrogenase